MCPGSVFLREGAWETCTVLCAHTVVPRRRDFDRVILVYQGWFDADELLEGAGCVERREGGISFEPREEREWDTMIGITIDGWAMYIFCKKTCEKKERKRENDREE